MMVSILTNKPPSAPQFRATTPVVLEHTVRTQVDAEFSVNSIMSTMGQFPFAPSDGFAVQLAITQALQKSLGTAVDSDVPIFRVRTHITASYIRIQIEDLEAEDLSHPSRFSNLMSNESGGLRLVRTFMTNVEFRKQGRQAILYRVRGQGAAISGPPLGYDFQI